MDTSLLVRIVNLRRDEEHQTALTHLTDEELSFCIANGLLEEDPSPQLIEHELKTKREALAIARAQASRNRAREPLQIWPWGQKAQAEREEYARSLARKTQLDESMREEQYALNHLLQIPSGKRAAIPEMTAKFISMYASLRNARADNLKRIQEIDLDVYIKHFRLFSESSAAVANIIHAAAATNLSHKELAEILTRHLQRHGHKKLGSVCSGAVLPFVAQLTKEHGDYAIISCPREKYSKKHLLGLNIVHAASQGTSGSLDVLEFDPQITKNTYPKGNPLVDYDITRKAYYPDGVQTADNPLIFSPAIPEDLETYVIAALKHPLPPRPISIDGKLHHVTVANIRRGEHTYNWDREHVEKPIYVTSSHQDMSNYWDTEDFAGYETEKMTSTSPRTSYRLEFVR